MLGWNYKYTEQRGNWRLKRHYKVDFEVSIGTNVSRICVKE
jgi:hypothetical protein